MIDTSIEVINKLGLHARASGKLIELTSQYQASIQLGRGSQLIDAKNIMALLMLGAAQGTTLHLSISGTDEQLAYEAICALFANRFGEGE